MQPTEVGIGQATATSCFLRPMLLLPKFGQTPTKIIAHVAINETPQNKRVLARELCRVLRRNQEQIWPQIFAFKFCDMCYTLKPCTLPPVPWSRLSCLRATFDRHPHALRSILNLHHPYARIDKMVAFPGFCFDW